MPDMQKKRIVLFVDFDGVLNCQMCDVFGTSREKLVFYPPNVALLNMLCVQTGAWVVVSSGWRRDFGKEALLSKLRKAYKAFGPRIGKSEEMPDFAIRFFTPIAPHPDAHECWRTPDFETNPTEQKGRFIRSAEIQRWLEKWGGDVQRWMAVDDEPSRYERQHIQDGRLLITRDSDGLNSEGYYNLLSRLAGG